MSLLVQLSHTQYRQNLRVPQILYESEGGIHRLDMDTFPKTCARAVSFLEASLSLHLHECHHLCLVGLRNPNLSLRLLFGRASTLVSRPDIYLDSSDTNPCYLLHQSVGTEIAVLRVLGDWVDPNSLFHKETLGIK